MDCDWRQQRHSVPTMLPVVDILTLSHTNMIGKMGWKLHWNDMNDDCNCINNWSVAEQYWTIEFDTIQPRESTIYPIDIQLEIQCVMCVMCCLISALAGFSPKAETGLRFTGSYEHAPQRDQVPSQASKNGGCTSSCTFEPMSVHSLPWWRFWPGVKETWQHTIHLLND